MCAALIGKVQNYKAPLAGIMSCLEGTSGRSISRILSSNGEVPPRLGDHLSWRHVATPL